MRRVYGTVFGLIALCACQPAQTVPAPQDPASKNPALKDNAPSPVPTPAARPVASVADISGAWQTVCASDCPAEVMQLWDRTLDYETDGHRQAGWEVASLDDGRAILSYTRGPGVSAIAFPDADRPLFDVLRSGDVEMTIEGEDLIIANGSETVRLARHPGEGFALPQGEVWQLDASYDDLAERLPFEFSQARLTFDGFTAGTYAGCNGGGATFTQTETAFVPSGLIMTQMACPNDGDAVAAWLVREGPPFRRDGDRLWRDFPEGRVSFRRADAPTRR